MMQYKNYYYKILCEDRNHFHFVRGWLKKKGADERKIEPFGKFPHKDSGREFVKKHFEDEVNKIRGKSKIVSTLLVVVIDADVDAIDDIDKDLPTHDSDPVFIVITKWSIETWARFLLDPDHENSRDEAKTCKNEFRNAKFGQLGKQLASDYPTIDPRMPGSLRDTFNRVKAKKESLRL